MQPGDAARVACPANMPEVEYVGGWHILVFSTRPVCDDAVGDGRTEAVEEHAVESAVAGVGRGAYGLASDESHSGAAALSLQELAEEIAIHCDLP